MPHPDPNIYIPLVEFVSGLQEGLISLYPQDLELSPRAEDGWIAVDKLSNDDPRLEVLRRLWVLSQRPGERVNLAEKRERENVVRALFRYVLASRILPEQLMSLPGAEFAIGLNGVIYSSVDPMEVKAVDEEKMEAPDPVMPADMTQKDEDAFVASLLGRGGPDSPTEEADSLDRVDADLEATKKGAE